ncbi:MAG TPA: TonB-dependent receptor [Steroidobacteraceae bacterium]
MNRVEGASIRASVRFALARSRKIGWSAPVIALMTLGAPAALAQNTGEEGLQEIVVTAQFREERLQDTPIAITAVSEEMLRERSQTSIWEVTHQAPNVQLRPAPAAFGPGLNAFIRGIGQDDFNFAFEPGVGMYVDDVYYSTLHGAVLDMLDLERVEVLRGPQGTLQGRNSIGGAIRLITRKPTGDGPGFLEVGVGRFNKIDVRGAAEFTVVPDKLFARIAGVTRSKDGYQKRVDFACENGYPDGIPTNTFSASDDCVLGTAGGQKYSGGRLTLRFVPNDMWDITLAGDITDDNSEVQANTLRAARENPNIPGYGAQFVPGTPYVTYSSFCDNGLAAAPFSTDTFVPNPFGAFCIPPVNQIEQHSFSANINIRLNDVFSLQSISAYREFDAEFAEDVDGSPLPAETVMNRTTHHGFQQELRLNGSAGELLDFTVGAFYFEQTNGNSNRVDIPYTVGLGRVLDFTGDDTISSDTWAVFAHTVWNLTDAASLTLGARYTEESKDYRFSRLAPDGGAAPIVGPLQGVVSTFEGDNFDYRISFDYRWGEPLLTYVTYSTGFKGGGVNPRPFFPEQAVPFDKETLKTFEFGFKSDLLDRRLRMNGALFYSWYDDMQLVPLSCPDITPGGVGPCAAPRNLADSEMWGAELEVAFRPTDAFSIDGQVSWIEFEYKRVGLNVKSGIDLNDPAVRNPSTGALAVDPNADAPEVTPNLKISLGAQYEFSLGDYGYLIPRVDFYYQDDAEGLAGTSASPTAVVESYETVNTRLTWRSADDRWEAAFIVTNLTNKEYFYNTFDLLGLAGFASAQPAPPREWGITFRRTFE